MARPLGSVLRPLAVWAGVGVAAVTAGAAVPAAWAAAAAGAGPDAVGDLLLAACTTALALALGWFWLVTTTTVAGLLSGRVRTRGTTRRLVLLACGVAVAAGTTLPAHAAGGDSSELLVGLSLPERAVAPAHHVSASHPAPGSGDTYVVRPGDSLSSIALDHPGAGSLDDRWRAIWRANRAVIGDDPDLILPGQALRLPGRTHPIQQDGDR